MNAINLAEAIDVLERIHALAREAVEAAVRPLVGSPLAIVHATEAQAWEAAELRRRHYHRRSPLSLADCFLLASASSNDAIATADPHVADVAREHGIEVVALPDSAGRRP
jgi:predicted nucleic acid-binding protein